MLIVLLIRGLTLPGAAIGIQFYLYPDLGRLADPQVLINIHCLCLGCDYLQVNSHNVTTKSQ